MPSSRPPRFLPLEAVVRIHEHLIDRHGGQHGIRDEGLLDSALAQPKASFGGQFLCSDLEEMAAAYLFHLAANHPFLDGNKRIAAAAAIAFLQLNGVDVRIPEEEFEEMVWRVARGELDKRGIADFLRPRLRR